MDEQTATFNLIAIQREIRTLDRQIERLIGERSRKLRDAADMEAILKLRNVPVTVLPALGSDGGA